MLKDGKFTRLKVMQLQGALNAVLPDAAPDSVQQKLANFWPNYADDC